jgi:hypothetical protein
LQISPMERSARGGTEVATVKRGVQGFCEGQYLCVIDDRIEIPDVASLIALRAARF